MFFFFFFKQKTAYEMRISDWSSDVCSSDLGPRLSLRGADVEGVQLGIIGAWDPHVAASTKFRRKPAPGLATCHSGLGDRSQAPQFSAALRIAANQSTGILFVTFTRSEEHTSELQSLMRNSYAVFCVKKKHKQ